MYMCARVQLREDHENEGAPREGEGGILPMCDYIWKQEFKKKERENMIAFLQTSRMLSNTFLVKPSGE